MRSAALDEARQDWMYEGVGFIWVVVILVKVYVSRMLLLGC